MLIKCNECGREISDKALNCPHCGYPINEEDGMLQDKDENEVKIKQKEEKHIFAWIISVITFMCAFGYSQYIWAMFFYIIASILVNPIFLNFLKNKGVRINKIIQIIIWFVVVGIAASFLPESEVIENNDVKVEVVQNEIVEEISEIKNEIENTEDENEIYKDPLYNFDIEEDINVFVETYYNNELDGNKKYFGKRVKLEGILNNIETDDSVFFNMGTTCFLKTNKQYDVACNFLEGNAKGLSEYSRNNSIVIIGEVDTLQDAYPKDVIYLKKCVVVEK